MDERQQYVALQLVVLDSILLLDRRKYARCDDHLFWNTRERKTLDLGKIKCTIGFDRIRSTLIANIWQLVAL